MSEKVFLIGRVAAAAAAASDICCGLGKIFRRASLKGARVFRFGCSSLWVTTAAREFRAEVCHAAVWRQQWCAVRIN